MELLSIAPRFCGPPGVGNGGYACGLVAQHARGIVTVRLARPVPLGVPLELRAHERDVIELLHQETLIASARPGTLPRDAPRPPSYLEALDASRHYLGFQGHALPRCFVCGPERARGDGLRIFAGPWNGVVAAPWVPDPSLSPGDGKVRPEFMWAALDCPGYFAARDDRVPMVLGEFTAHVDRRVHVDEPCVVVGWRIGASGRRHEVGTALYDEDGEVCALARAMWIEPHPATSP